jgi:enoyl-[acyl-carrier protein] reductase I
VRAIDLSGKTALILGVANKRSLAWAIAEALGEAGAKLAFTYQGDRLQDNVVQLAAAFPDALVMACDVNSDEQVEGVFAHVAAPSGSWTS